ncbi:unnamed protein product [Ilex paraguariensis]|uniref:peptidylprolyl isomerase n=1 Tax=Ilex paraguariensis TaxID=185542 RepID=A0ABC8SBC7_9AQUA
MAFWGIEVKPGKPVTHSFDSVRGRLRISQATLGIGSSTKKSLIQCNVGNKSPVMLCALLPDKTESCHLDLEFEESDDVVFSVLGPRSVYLTGYYVGNYRRSRLDDDTDSFGEDIANTETEESTRYSDEDKYEDSFIDDDNPEICPPSPVSSGGVDEGMPAKEKSKDRKHSHKRLKKKYQSIESSDDTSLGQQNIAINSGVLTESEDEDKLVLSAFKSKTTGKNTTVEAVEQANTATPQTGDKKTDGVGTRVNPSKGKADDMAINGEPKKDVDLSYNSLLPSDEVNQENGTEPQNQRKEFFKQGKTVEDYVDNQRDALIEGKAQLDEPKANNIIQDLLLGTGKDQKPATDTKVGPGYVTKSKKKRKARTDEVKALETDTGNNSNPLKGERGQQADAKADNKGQDNLVRNDQKPTTNMEFDFSCNSLLSSGEMGSKNSPQSKRRRKERGVDGKSVDCNVANSSKVLEENQSKQGQVKAGMEKGLPVIIEQDQKPTSDKSNDVHSVEFGDMYQSEEKKKTKRKKKKGKTKENEGYMDTEVPFLQKEEENRSVIEDNSVDATSYQVRTLSNGLIIEELETGKPDGKIAAPGRKVKVYYTGKLKENGQIFDSNIDKSPYKFRLGDNEIIEGWNVGLDGMRVGDKRRLTIPPSMGYGSQGGGENIPPNSWLVYDVQLTGVHR